jgi:hypothetical protein
MPTPESSLEALANRIAKLEVQNQRLKKMGIASLVAAAVIAMGRAPIKKVIEANEFVLQDSSGKARAKLLMDSSGTPSLEFDFTLTLWQKATVESPRTCHFTLTESGRESSVRFWRWCAWCGRRRSPYVRSSNLFSLPVWSKNSNELK